MLKNRRSSRARALTHRRFADLCRERGQATVEFAIVLPVLLLLVLGMLDFGRAVNYYNTLTELSAEGARSAAVNRNPDGTAVSGLSIQNQVKCQATSTEMTSSNTYHVAIASPLNSNPIKAGQPVKVTATYTFNFLSFLRIQTLNRLTTLNLVGSSTMRAEQDGTYTLGNDNKTSCP
jgi:Flp pilus assembly protein TadG